MNKKILWFVMSSLMALSLVIMACGQPAAPTPPTAPVTPTPPPPVTPAAPAAPVTEKPQQEAVKPATDTPKYGGTITVVGPALLDAFDSAASPTGHNDVQLLVYEQFLYPDWSKGQSGSGQFDLGLQGVIPIEAWGPQLAESWKIPEVGTWVLKLRQGVHYALDPTSEASKLVNGREFTADDAVYNVRRFTIDPAFTNAGMRRSLPAMAAATTIEKTGPNEVTLKTPVDPWNGFFWIVWGGTSTSMAAPEVIKKYGSVSSWRNSVGTGPYMIADHVAGSQTTFKKNPNYWGKDPVGPGKGNQLPYVDNIKLLQVPDVSTRLAALRTGKADWVTGVEWYDTESLLKTNPQLQVKRYLPYGRSISMRQDKADLPFKDIKVRHALMMATDFESIKNDLYKGQAEILVYPLPPIFDWLHTSMEKLPETVQSLYKYNPERAKQLLKEAGYPNGFKTTMIVQSTSTEIDAASVIKAMWVKVGVDVELQPKELTTYSAISTARTWEDTFMGAAGVSTLYTTILSLGGYRGASLTDVVKDQKAIDTYDQMQKSVFVDMPKVDELFRSLVPYLMEQAYVIPRPVPYSATMWQPWLKNYHGEKTSGILTLDLWPQHVWIDQELKKSMGY
ncbi:MAG: ABC transporter substrate-binding protein [Chloroflexi bacterium]|nr:ABC transporter substrate-binding protein [Chloroflexota bacterium]